MRTSRKDVVRGYPCICENTEDGSVVLFRAAGEGMVIEQGTAFSVGYYTDCWQMDVFKKFIGIVSLEND